jgi:XRE family aerobic/anaerobic benzoate catabolism transcriptional regulator
MSPRPKLRGHSPQDRAYLRILADKIRYARAQRGMTRNALAVDSGVSLRFLAQLESGQGNPSVLVLRRIASAMGFAPDWLLSDEPMRHIDQMLPMRVLKRLSEKDLRKAGQLLTHHFGHDGVAATPTRYITVPSLARHHQTPRASSSRVDRPLRKR